MSFERQLHLMQPQQHLGPDSRVWATGPATELGAKDTPPPREKPTVTEHATSATVQGGQTRGAGAAAARHPPARATSSSVQGVLGSTSDTLRAGRQDASGASLC